VAGPPGFEPGTSGSEDPGNINHVSSKNHQLETLFTNAYHRDIIADKLETSRWEKAIGS